MVKTVRFDYLYVAQDRTFYLYTCGQSLDPLNIPIASIDMGWEVSVDDENFGRLTVGQ